MLVLTRKIGESLMVGDSVEVVVLEVRGSIVRLGIDAPKNIDVHRREIYDKIQAEKRTGVSSHPKSPLNMQGRCRG